MNDTNYSDFSTNKGQGDSSAAPIRPRPKVGGGWVGHTTGPGKVKEEQETPIPQRQESSEIKEKLSSHHAEQQKESQIPSKLFESAQETVQKQQPQTNMQVDSFRYAMDRLMAPTNEAKAKLNNAKNDYEAAKQKVTEIEDQLKKAPNITLDGKNPYQELSRKLEQENVECLRLKYKVTKAEIKLEDISSSKNDTKIQNLKEQANSEKAKWLDEAIRVSNNKSIIFANRRQELKKQIDLLHEQQKQPNADKASILKEIQTKLTSYQLTFESLQIEQMLRDGWKTDKLSLEQLKGLPLQGPLLLIKEEKASVETKSASQESPTPIRKPTFLPRMPYPVEKTSTRVVETTEKKFSTAKPNKELQIKNLRQKLEELSKTMEREGITSGKFPEKPKEDVGQEAKDYKIEMKNRILLKEKGKGFSNIKDLENAVAFGVKLIAESRKKRGLESEGVPTRRGTIGSHHVNIF
jgi:hypothetical protein